MKKEVSASWLVELGLLLHRARHSRTEQEFNEYLRHIKIAPTRARRAIRLTRDWRVVRNAHKLPPNIDTIEQISKLDDIVLSEALAMKIINPNMTLDAAKELRRV